jgi:hypothetical protein
MAISECKSLAHKMNVKHTTTFVGNLTDKTLHYWYTWLLALFNPPH